MPFPTHIKEIEKVMINITHSPTIPSLTSNDYKYTKSKLHHLHRSRSIRPNDQDLKSWIEE